MTRRERLAHPLDDVPSIKLKLGFVIAAAVAVTVFVFWVLIKIGVWPSVSGIIAAAIAMVMVWFLSRGMTSPLRQMAAAASEMAKGNYDRRVSTSSRDEVGELARAFNQMAAELAETDRVRARPGGERVARAADAHHRAAGGAREPGRRRHRARPRDVPHHARPGRALGPPGQAAPRPVAARVGRGAARPHGVPGGTAPRPRGPGAAAARTPRSRCRCRSTPPTSPPTAIPSACTRWSRTCSRTRCATRRAAARSRCAPVAAPTASPSRCSTRAPASPTPTRPASSSGSTGPTRPGPRRDGGAGLGLAIAQWIVDLHGGDIHPEKREPHGCRMVVTLPHN